MEGGYGIGDITILNMKTHLRRFRVNEAVDLETVVLLKRGNNEFDNPKISDNLEVMNSVTLK